jgi:L-asparaginase
VDAAVREAALDMRQLKGGLINRVTIHAIDTKGNHKVVAVNGNPKNVYWLWRRGDAAPQSLPAEIITSSPVVAKPSPSEIYGARCG